MILHARRIVVELLLVLDGAQPLDEPDARDELEPAAAQRLDLRVRERRRLEADAARQPLGEVGDHGALRLDDLDALDGARRLEVAEVGEELDALLVDEQRRVRALEAGEVDDVLRVRDEERLLERLPQAGDPVVHAFSLRYSSAMR